MLTSSPRAPLLLLRLLLLPVLLLGAGLGGRSACAEPPDALVSLKKAHAKRLSMLAEAAKDAHLAAVALRLFQQANGLDPELAEPRLALGWTRAGSDWKEPDPRVVAGTGWADDGEANLARFEKQEAAARLEHGKDLVDAAMAARARMAPPAEVDRLLWAAIAADPDDPGPRKALGHRQDGERYVAPEHRLLLAAMREKAWCERAATWASIPVAEGKIDGALVPGYVPTVRLVAGPAPDVAVGLGDAGTVRAAAQGMAAARALLDELLGAPEDARVSLTMAVVGTRGAFDALLAAGGVEKDARALAKGWAAWPLASRTTYALLAGRPSDAAVEAAGAMAEADASARGAAGAARAGSRRASRASSASTPPAARRASVARMTATAGDTGPLRRAGESVGAFARRMVAWEQDPSLRDIAADAHALHPRDVAKVGSILAWLALLGPGRFQGFVKGVIGTPGTGAARLEAATKAAGFQDVGAFEAAWRRYALDLGPMPTEPGADRKEPWKVTKLERAKKAPVAGSLHGDPVHEVTGSLWLGGRPYPCEVVEGGAAVRLYPLTQRAGDRFQREPGVAPFTIPAEYGGGWTSVRVELEKGGSAWTVRNADAWQGSVDGHLLTFFDVDLDGRFGGFDRDGVLVGDGAVMQPLRRDLVIGGKAYEVPARRPRRAGRRVARAAPRAGEGARARGVPALERVAGRLRRAGAPLGCGPRERAGAPRGGAAVRGPRTAGRSRRRRRSVDAWDLRGGAPRPGPARGRGRAHGRDPCACPGAARRRDAVRVRARASRRAGSGPRRGRARRRGETGPALLLRWPEGTDLAGLALEVTLATASGTVVGLGAPAVAGSTATLLPAAPLQPKLAYRVVARFGPAPARLTRTWTFTTGNR